MKTLVVAIGVMGICERGSAAGVRVVPRRPRPVFGRQVIEAQAMRIQPSQESRFASLGIHSTNHLHLDAGMWVLPPGRRTVGKYQAGYWYGSTGLDGLIETSHYANRPLYTRPFPSAPLNGAFEVRFDAVVGRGYRGILEVSLLNSLGAGYGVQLVLDSSNAGEHAVNAIFRLDSVHGLPRQDSAWSPADVARTVIAQATGVDRRVAVSDKIATVPVSLRRSADGDVMLSINGRMVADVRDGRHDGFNVLCFNMPTAGGRVAFTNPEVVGYFPDELRMLDYPIYVIVGQTFRLLVDTPEGTPPLTVDAPSTVELVDRSPARPKDPVQRFYFRAVRPGPADVSFRAGRLALTWPCRVLSWAEVLEPRRYDGRELPRIWPVGRDYQKLKPGLTMSTEEESARRRQPGSKPSEKLAAMTLDEVYDSLLGSYVPRIACTDDISGGPSKRGGCPDCGSKIYAHNKCYPWRLDPARHPGKVGCPDCGRWLPDNDFVSGDLSSGGVADDGFGVDLAGYRSAFVAYYNMHHCKTHFLGQTLWALGNEYARTGDRDMARKTAVALLRLSEQILNLAVNINQRWNTTVQSLRRNPMGIRPRRNVPLRGQSMYFPDYWAVPWVRRTAEVYEMVFAALHEEDEELLAFCRRRHHPEIRTVADLRRFIETGYFRVMAQAVLDESVVGNGPPGRCAVTNIALLLGTPEARDLVDWVLNRGGNLRFFLINNFFKDGSPREASGSYNAIYVRDLDQIVGIMEKLRSAMPEVYGTQHFASLADDPKYKQIFDFLIDSSLIDRCYAPAGDDGQGGYFDPGRQYPLPIRQTSYVRREDFALAYAITRDRRFAQVLHGPDGKIPDAVSEPELVREIRQVVAEDGWEVPLKSNITDGHGHAMLRSGEGDHKRAVWIRYGMCTTHWQDDLMSIGLEALQGRMLTDFSYPDFAQRFWVSGWQAHYRVHVRGRQTPGRGALALFSIGDGVQAAAAHIPAAPVPPRAGVPGLHFLPPGGVHERTLVLVDLSPEDFYVLDVFRVAGGNEHWWAFHGPAHDSFDLRGAHLTPQEGGSALGRDVPYGRPRPQDRDLEGLAWMYDVQRTAVDGPWSLDFAFKKDPDVHLRTTVIPPDGAELILARGRAPRLGKPSVESEDGGANSAQFALLATRGERPLRSQFVQVLEAYRGQRAIDEIAPVRVSVRDGHSTWATAVRVRSGLRTDTCVLNRSPDERCRTDDGLTVAGSVGFRSRDAEGLCALFLAQGTYIRAGDAELTLSAPAHVARIVAADYAQRRLVIRPPLPEPQAVVGRYLRIVNDAGNDTAFRIDEAVAVPDGTQITVDVDARIAEGYVEKVEPDLVDGSIHLPLARLPRYYHGKTLSNEDGTVLYRTLGAASSGKGFVIDQQQHGTVPAERLRRQFLAPEGAPTKRYIVYDYGIGDTVVFAHTVSVTRIDREFRITSTAPGSLQLPGRAAVPFPAGNTRLP